MTIGLTLINSSVRGGQSTTREAFALTIVAPHSPLLPLFFPTFPLEDFLEILSFPKELSDEF